MGGSTATDLASLLREYGAVKLGDVVKVLQKGVEDDLEVRVDFSVIVFGGLGCVLLMMMETMCVSVFSGGGGGDACM